MGEWIFIVTAILVIFLFRGYIDKLIAGRTSFLISVVSFIILMIIFIRGLVISFSVVKLVMIGVLFAGMLFDIYKRYTKLELSNSREMKEKNLNN